MKHLHIFNIHTLKEALQSRHNIAPTRRIFDVLPILLGTGFLNAHSQLKKTYVYVGLNGVSGLLCYLKKHPHVPCPFDDFKQLRSVGWQCVHLLATGKKITVERLILICGNRRRYDVGAVLTGAGICTIDNTQLKKPVKRAKKEAKKEQQERKELKVSNEEIIDIFGPDVAVYFEGI
jgi:hypothetical protein